MSPRLSLRAQIAAALALALFLGGALNGFVVFGLGRRSVLDERRAAAEAIAVQLAARCAPAEPECLERQAALGATPSLRLRLVRLEAATAFERSTGAPVHGSLLVVEPGASGQRPERFGSALLAYLLLDSLVAFVVGFVLLNRAVSRPVDRLAEAAERIGRLELDDPLGARGPLLGRLGVAFERMSKSLREERARVSRQIDELRGLNRQLAQARDSLVRSEKLATTGRLAAGVAHEIGNPLGAILGYLELAKSRSTPEAGQFLDCIDREVGRIDRTVRELLDFSRPAGLGPLAPLDLREAVEAAVRLASVQKRLKTVEFELEVPAGLSVTAEAHHLSQVLVNVLLNAGDAMGGQGRIWLRAERAGERVELSVRDSGPGIAPEDLQRIFDPFFTTKDPGEGTGLGLSICHRILESFGGEIRAENSPEGGALFVLSLAPAAGA